MSLKMDLDAPECQEWIWGDRDAALWFWNADAQDWFTLEAADDGWVLGQSEDDGEDDGKPWRDAPFIALIPNQQYVPEESR